uniref:Death domain-containing protein n=2 Tax=Amphimedon queenslandica TaxID=400682 RepID=A0A1X7U958_AMPQE
MATSSDKSTASSSEAEKNVEDVVEQLRRALKEKRYEQATPLLQYLMAEDNGKALEIAKNDKFHFNQKNDKFRFNQPKGIKGSFLHYAVKGNHVDVVRFLIEECECDPSTSDERGFDNSYAIAVEYESIDVLKYLFNCHRSTCGLLRGSVCSIIFSKAVRHINSLKCLINDCNVDPMVRHGKVGSLLNHAVLYDSMEALKYLINECNCDPMAKSDIWGSTILHCAARRDKSEAVEFLLSTGKCDPLKKDRGGYTPLGLAKGKTKTLSVFKKFGNIKISHPVDSYVNVLLVGNPGAGKSTLSHVINDTATGPFAFGSYRNVGGVVPCTAGIIPYKLQHRTLGNIILHDFAGHSEYYSSHSAVIENLLQGSGGVFLIVVNILEKEAVKQLHHWLTVVRNEAQKALNQCHILVAVSHVDEISDPVESRRKEEMQDIIVREKCDSVFLDCRKHGGSDMDSFFKKLSSACKSIRSTSGRNLSLYCHMMYGLLEERKENILTLSDVMSAGECNNSYAIPDNEEEVLEVLHSLHSTGLISVLKSEGKTWVVVNKGILLTEVDGILFAPETFKEHVDIASNTGIVSVSGLTRLFPKYDPDMLICFLKNMELCQEMNPSFLRMTNLHQLAVEEEEEGGRERRGERLLFFPCLLSTDRPDEMTSQVYQFGWCLQCTSKHHFFPPRYFHVLSLHLAFKMALPQEDDKLNRRCMFWKNGLYWSNSRGVGSLVEIVDESQCVLVMMSFKKYNMVSLRKDVIGEVMSVYKESCPSLEVKELVIDPKELAYPVNTPRERTVYSVKDVMSAIDKREEFLVNANGTCEELKRILPDESLSDISNLSLLGGRDIKGDGKINNDEGIVGIIKEEYGTASKGHSDIDVQKAIDEEQEKQTDKLLDITDLATVLQELESNQQFSYTDWYQLGLYLGLYERTLKAIEEDYKKSKKCLMECISSWLKGEDGVRETRGGGSNWISLVAALDTIGQRKVADNIRKKYLHVL